MREYSARWWKYVTGVVPIDPDAPHLACLPLENREMQIQHLQRDRERFAPYINASNRTTQYGILLEIILSEAPLDVVRSALHGYWGFRSGFRTFVKLIEAENKRLYEIAPVGQPDDPFYWSINGKSHIDDLCQVLCWMEWDQSHMYLMHLAKGDYHPLVQAEAICAMANDLDHFESEFFLELVNSPKTPILKVYHALYGLRQNFHGHYDNMSKKQEYFQAVWPFIKHSDWNIYTEAISAMSRWYGGRLRLREYLDSLKSEPNSDPRKIKEIESDLEFFNDHDKDLKKRILRRANIKGAPYYDHLND